MQPSPASSPRLVLVLGRPGDAIARMLASTLRESFEVIAGEVTGPAELRELVEGHREQLGVLVVGASDPTSASTLVWELDRGLQWLSERTLVVVDTYARLDAVPGRLLESLRYVPLDKAELEDVAGLVADMLAGPREIDPLASLFRSAVERRSVESLPPLHGDWGSVERLDPAHVQLAHVADGGRRPNLLWAHWVARRHGAAIERLGERLAAHRRSEALAAAEPPLTNVAQPSVPSLDDGWGNLEDLLHENASQTKAARKAKKAAPSVKKLEQAAKSAVGVIESKLGRKKSKQ